MGYTIIYLLITAYFKLIGQITIILLTQSSRVGARAGNTVRNCRVSRTSKPRDGSTYNERSSSYTLRVLYMHYYYYGVFQRMSAFIYMRDHATTWNITHLCPMVASVGWPHAIGEQSCSQSKNQYSYIATCLKAMMVITYTQLKSAYSPCHCSHSCIPVFLYSIHCLDESLYADIKHAKITCYYSSLDIIT